MKIKFRNHHFMSVLKWAIIYTYIILVLLDAIAILFHFISFIFSVLLENCRVYIDAKWSTVEVLMCTLWLALRMTMKRVKLTAIIVKWGVKNANGYLRWAQKAKGKKSTRKTVTTPTFKRLHGHTEANNFLCFFSGHLPKKKESKCKNAITCCQLFRCHSGCWIFSSAVYNCAVHVPQQWEICAGKECEIAVPIAYECIFHDT